MSTLTVARLAGTAATISQTNIPAGQTLNVQGNIYHDGTGALRLPTGTTAERPGSPQSGYIRWNTDTSAVEVYTGSTWKVYSAENGSSGSPFTSLNNVSTSNPYNGFYFCNFDGGGNEEMYLYKDSNNKWWAGVASITDTTNHGSYTGGSDNWYGNWSNTTTFGSGTGFMGADFKSRHYHNWSVNDVLIMQGWSTSGDPYSLSTEVAYINSVFTNRGGNMKEMFEDHIGLGNHGNIGGTQIGGMTFLKGSATASDNRYRGSSAGELNPNNTWHVSPANCENYTMSMINALGCASNGCNVEHHCWVGNTGNNYSNQNFPEPNWSGSWGINNPGSQNWMYWLFFYGQGG